LFFIIPLPVSANADRHDDHAINYVDVNNMEAFRGCQRLSRALSAIVGDEPNDPAEQAAERRGSKPS
jgi:hypothetical protein